MFRFILLHFYEGIFDTKLHFYEGISGVMLHFYEGIFSAKIHFYEGMPKKDDIFNVFYYTQIKDKGSSTDFCA